jgi:sugar transferase (PEP-CTERM/EpsH1 system associated)
LLTHRLPYPPDRGDRIRSYQLLKLLAAHFDLALACTSDEPVWLQHHELLRTMAKRVAIQPISASASRVRGLQAMLTGRSLTPAWYFRQCLADQVRQWHEQAPFDAVLTFCTGMLAYARLLCPPGARASRPAPVSPPPSAGGVVPAVPCSLSTVPSGVRHILDLVDVDSLKWQSYARSSWPPLSWAYRVEAARLRRIEAGRFDHFDAITLVSAHEEASFRASVGDHPGLTVVPNGVDLDYFSPQSAGSSKNIVFVGALNYRPNYEGIIWFVRHVMPSLRHAIPGVHLQVVGRNPTPAVRQLGEYPGVEVVGSVPDVRPYLGDAAAAIAPLQIARGVQNKVLEAMAAARPVVCSPGAARGLSAQDGRDLLVADTPQQWTDAISRVLGNAELRGQLARCGRQYVEQNHNWDRCLAPMIALLGGA